MSSGRAMWLGKGQPKQDGEAASRPPDTPAGQQPTRFPALDGSRTDPEAALATELAIIAEARLDPRAFAPLYERYVDLVYRYCLRRLGDPDRAADATSLVFSRAIGALGHFTPDRRGNGSTFRSWLLTIARNVVIDDARKNRPITQLDDTTIQAVLRDTAPSPEERAIAADERTRIEAAIAQLPERQRQIVELRLIGLRGAEIAPVLGMSVGAVKTAHFRAYARLRDLLAEPDHDGGQVP